MKKTNAPFASDYEMEILLDLGWGHVITSPLCLGVHLVQTCATATDSEFICMSVVFCLAGLVPLVSSIVYQSTLQAGHDFGLKRLQLSWCLLFSFCSVLVTVHFHEI